METPPSDQLTIDQVRHIATLCRIAMSAEELERMRKQLSHILEQFRVLQQVDTASVTPSGHSVDLHSVMREDQVTPSFPVEDVLANAPRREEHFVRVRAVLE